MIDLMIFASCFLSSSFNKMNRYANFKQNQRLWMQKFGSLESPKHLYICIRQMVNMNTFKPNSGKQKKAWKRSKTKSQKKTKKPSYLYIPTLIIRVITFFWRKTKQFPQCIRVKWQIDDFVCGGKLPLISRSRWLNVCEWMCWKITCLCVCFSNAFTVSTYMSSKNTMTTIAILDRILFFPLRAFNAALFKYGQNDCSTAFFSITLLRSIFSEQQRKKRAETHS